MSIVKKRYFVVCKTQWYGHESDDGELSSTTKVTSSILTDIYEFEVEHL